MQSIVSRPTAFYGWHVVGAAFVLAAFGMGLGFYGPPIYLHAVREARGWSLPLVSAAVTAHFLVGAVVVANLPTFYRHFGLPMVTKSGAVLLAVGVYGWAWAEQPWQLFAVAFLSGAGWVVMGWRRSTPSSLRGSCKLVQRRWPWPTTARTLEGSSSPLCGSPLSNGSAFRRRQR